MILIIVLVVCILFHGFDDGFLVDLHGSSVWESFFDVSFNLRYQLIIELVLFKFTQELILWENDSEYDDVQYRVHTPPLFTLVSSVPFWSVL